tara:strand:+ start:372 stop:554 length:183 start_codon:yes stop_codon:yes gene_type:complete
MVAFARARTKSWISRLWPMAIGSNSKEKIEYKQSQEVIDKHKEQNKRFLELNKNGGIWLS